MFVCTNFTLYRVRSGRLNARGKFHLFLICRYKIYRKFIYKKHIQVEIVSSDLLFGWNSRKRHESIVSVRFLNVRKKQTRKKINVLAFLVITWQQDIIAKKVKKSTYAAFLNVEATAMRKCVWTYNNRSSSPISLHFRVCICCRTTYLWFHYV